MTRRTQIGTESGASGAPLIAFREVGEQDFTELMQLHCQGRSICAERTCGVPPGCDAREYWLHCVLRRGLNYVAREGGRWVGHVALMRVGDAAEMCLFLAGCEHPRREIAAGLLAVAVNQAREIGVRHIVATADPEDSGLREALAQAGFTLSQRADDRIQLILAL